MQPTIDEIRQELDRLLEDPTFRRAPTHCRLLRYLVDRKTAGDDGALCEAGIAMAVFQRDPADYDAEVDPIVRVSIGRLRQRLEKHYQRFERAPQTVILLPPGRYAPEFQRPKAPGVAQPRGLAVMRTTNATGDPSFDALAHTLGDRLGEALVVLGLPRVIAPAAAAAVPHEGGAPDLQKQLGVSEVLETTLSGEPGQRLRIAARLLKAASSELVWAEVRTARLDEPYAAVDALLDAVLARFSAQGGSDLAVAGVPGSASRLQLPAAARSKLESARFLISQMTVAGVEQAHALLVEVTTEHPESADGWALRGRSCVRRLNFAGGSAVPLVAEIEQCVARALAINREHLDARALSGLSLHWSGRLAEAGSTYRDVLSIAPNHPNSRTGLAWLMLCQGRFDDALGHFDLATSFDPLSINLLLNRAYVMTFARRYDEARILYETALRADPSTPFALTAMAANEVNAGNLDRAEELYLRIEALAPHALTGRYGSAFVAARRGDHDRARAIGARLAEENPVGSHCAKATLKLLLGEPAAAIAELRQAFGVLESARLTIGVDSGCEVLAGDAEFVALLGKLGLERWCGVPAR